MMTIPPAALLQLHRPSPQVMDKNKLTSDDFLGEITLDWSEFVAEPGSNTFALDDPAGRVHKHEKALRAAMVSSARDDQLKANDVHATKLAELMGKTVKERKELAAEHGLENENGDLNADAFKQHLEEMKAKADDGRQGLIGLRSDATDAERIVGGDNGYGSIEIDIKE